MQSAALLVVRAGGGYSAFNDRYIDLRVDDHATPISELRRILDLHQLYFQPPDAAALLPLSGDRLSEVRALLHAAHYLPTVPTDPAFDAVTAAAFTAFAERENLEDRLRPDAQLDPVLLRYLRTYVQEKAAPPPVLPAGEPAHLHLVRPSQPGGE